ncbi:hypothetical protein K439DRAFT_1660581 [Ramaria rubella]|nr:hypothetical protein K439DRAFT_1660581 [Ramaria rubella]
MPEGKTPAPNPYSPSFRHPTASNHTRIDDCISLSPRMADVLKAHRTQASVKRAVLCVRIITVRQRRTHEERHTLSRPLGDGFALARSQLGASQTNYLQTLSQAGPSFSQVTTDVAVELDPILVTTQAGLTQLYLEDRNRKDHMQLDAQLSPGDDTHIHMGEWRADALALDPKNDFEASFDTEIDEALGPPCSSNSPYHSSHLTLPQGIPQRFPLQQFQGQTDATLAIGWTQTRAQRERLNKYLCNLRHYVSFWATGALLWRLRAIFILLGLLASGDPMPMTLGTNFSQLSFKENFSLLVICPDCRMVTHLANFAPGNLKDTKFCLDLEWKTQWIVGVPILQKTGAYKGVWDGKVGQELMVHDGKRFFKECEDDKLRLGLTSSLDCMFWSAFPWACAQLHDGFRYRVDNIIMSSMTAGLKEPSAEELQYHLKFIVDELLHLYKHGILIKTLRFPQGCIVHIVCIALGCDTIQQP